MHSLYVSKSNTVVINHPSTDQQMKYTPYTGLVSHTAQNTRNTPMTIFQVLQTKHQSEQKLIKTRKSTQLILVLSGPCLEAGIQIHCINNTSVLCITINDIRIIIIKVTE